MALKNFNLHPESRALHRCRANEIPRHDFHADVLHSDIEKTSRKKARYTNESFEEIQVLFFTRERQLLSLVKMMGFNKKLYNWLNMNSSKEP